MAVKEESQDTSAPNKTAKKAVSKKATKKKATKKKATKKKTTKKKTTKKKTTKKKTSTALPGVKPGTALVVVESPAKAKTIKKFLGRGFTVKASVGHVKDLPKSKISVDVDAGFEPKYEVIRGKSQIIKEIRDAARLSETVYLAPDPDREGEAIAWHIAQELGPRLAPRIKRIAFNEITKRAVREAIENPRPINVNLFHSQQARRVLDRLVGYEISPILWDKVRRGLSAGRVQSVAVRIIVEREAAIQAFETEEYWSIVCGLGASKSPPPFEAKVIKLGEEKFRPNSQEATQLTVDALEKSDFIVEEVKRKERRRKPQAPLITSKLQQEGAKSLRFTAKRTMLVAQQLYEGVDLGDEGSVGLITYMRTDSTRVADEAISEVRELIGQQWGSDYVPETPNIYKNKKSAQEGHEAIRPTSMAYPPDLVRPYLSAEQFKLYSLIWRFFVASQMTPAVFDQTTIDINAGEYTLRSTGSIMKFRGFLAAHAQGEAQEQDKQDGEDQGVSMDAGQLPALEKGQALACDKITPAQHFTQPPPRFADSSLVKELEEQGIGRPSTYATILSTIVSRQYVKKDEGKFIPTELGTLVTELLCISFPHVMDVHFTAQIEDKLDEVETGQVDWVQLLGDFYHGSFKPAVELAAVEMRDVKREEVPTEHKCEQCEAVMMVKWGRNGSFLACAGYPKCRNTRDYERQPDGSIELLPELTTDQLCPKCGASMLVKTGRYGQFLACSTYPECKGTRPVSIGVDCPKSCGGYVAERRSQRGRVFYGCSSYPDCDFVSWQRPVQGPCPECNSVYLIRKYTKRDGVRIHCPEKECSYQRDPELDDADAAVL